MKKGFGKLSAHAIAFRAVTSLACANGSTCCAMLAVV